MAGPEAANVSLEYLAKQIRSTSIMSKLPTIDPINGMETFKIRRAIRKSKPTLFRFNAMSLEMQLYGY